MATTPSGAVPAAPQLLAAAQGGDQSAFTALVEPHRRELHAHCYRMLGSVHDAEDALQDALLRAWRSLRSFDGRGPVRPWLYKIATNTSLDLIAKRKRQRILPQDHRPAADPAEGPGEPLVETVWIEPYPDETFAVEDGYAAPEARYEQRESVELAFVAALQHLPANQRAALIMREVLGFSAQECADLLETSVPSVNSALQRARKTVEDKLPEQSQQETLRAIGDDGVRSVVEGYMEAMSSGDIDTMVTMLTDDADWSMPPVATWFHGPDLREFLEVGPLSGKWRWKHLPTTINAQPAIGSYAWHDGEGCYLPFAFDILRLAPDGRIAEIVSFITRTIDVPDRDALRNYPEQVGDPRRMELFDLAGLPARLD